MYPTSSIDVLTAALSGRSWKAITLRAQRLKLIRKRGSNSQWRYWAQEDDTQLQHYYQEGMKLQEIAGKLGRSESSVMTRIRDKGLKRSLTDTERLKPVSWESYDLITLHGSPPRGGHRG
jgi:hypothetical protein